jgi:hypothetical protein
MVVRVTGIDTGEAGAGAWRIEAIEDVFSLGTSVLASTPAQFTPPEAVPLAPACVLAFELPYWELARHLTRADLASVEDTDTCLGALAAAGGPGQLNWQLLTGPSPAQMASVASGDYAPLFMLDAALAATEADALAVPVTALVHPERLSVGDIAYLLDASGGILEAVAIVSIALDGLRLDLARGVLDTTPQSHGAGARLIGVGEWAASEELDRAPGETVYVGAQPFAFAAQGEPALAGNAPLVLVGRQTRPYPPGRIRINGQIEPETVTGEITLSWAHRDRAQQTAVPVRQHEGDIGPEPGVTVTVRIRNAGGEVLHLEEGIEGNTCTWTAADIAAAGVLPGEALTLELTAERNGWTSWQAQVRRFVLA